MIKKSSPAKKQPSAKEKIFAETTQLLADSLGTLKDFLGEKKFEKRIRKAAKLLVQGFKLPAVKQSDANLAPVKKASPGRPRKAVAVTDEKAGAPVAKKKGSVGRPRKLVTPTPGIEVKAEVKKKGSVGRPRKITAELIEKEVKAVPTKKGSVGRPRKILAATPEKEVKAVSKKKAAAAPKSVKAATKK